MKSTPPEISRTGTRCLLALAAILITNSHLEHFYPSPLLAGDGLLGNSIFFMAAGMGVTLSARTRTRSFLDYYWRRIVRIYPTVLIVVTVFILGLGSKWREWDWRDYLANYFFPTPWAFVAHIMVYYIVLFPLLRAPSRRVFGFLFLLLVPAFAYVWWQHAPATPRLVLGLLDPPIYYVFWFAMVILGAWIAAGPAQKIGSLLLKLVLFTLTFLVYLGLKVLFVTGRAGHFQFLLFVIAAVLVWLLVQIVLSESVTTWIERHRWVKSTLLFVGGLTLEIYTIQPFLAKRRELSDNIPFPLNIVCFWLLLLLLAWTVERLVSMIRRDRGRRPAAVV